MRRVSFKAYRIGCADTLAEERGISRAALEAHTAVKHPMGRNACPEGVALAVRSCHQKHHPS